MKMKSLLIASAIMAVGMVGTASGNGATPPPSPTIECNDDPVEFCVGTDLVEVELKCIGDYIGGIWVGDDLADLLNYEGWTLDIDWALGVQDGEDYVCGALGWHDVKKTEGKCTNQMNGPTNGKSKKWGSNVRPAVEYEFKTVEEDSSECP